MSIPTSLTLHLEALHGLVAVEGIFNCTRQYMVNARMAIGRGRTLEEYKLRTSFALVNRTPEDIVLAPAIQHVIIHLGEVQAARFGKLLSHCIFSLFDYILSNRLQKY